MSEQETKLRLQVRKMEGRDARKLAAFWEKHENIWKNEVSPRIADLSAETFKQVFENLHKFEKFLRGRKMHRQAD